MAVTFYNQDRKDVFLEGIGWFQFNQAGKIQHEKQFFDLAYFLSQL